MLVQSFQIRPNSHCACLLQTLLFIISATVTTGYVKIPSNFYHQLPIPRCPGPPRGVKFVCISPPGNRVINFPFIYQELLPKRKSFIGCDLWEEREKGLISREGERRQRKGKVGSFGCPGQMENAKFPGAFSPLPSPEDTFPTSPPHHCPGLSHRVMWGLSDAGTKGGYLSFSSVANRPGPLQAGRREEGGAGLLLAFLGSWGVLGGGRGEKGAQHCTFLPLHS